MGYGETECECLYAHTHSLAYWLTHSMQSFSIPLHGAALRCTRGWMKGVAQGSAATRGEAVGWYSEPLAGRYRYRRWGG